MSITKPGATASTRRPRRSQTLLYFFAGAFAWGIP